MKGQLPNMLARVLKGFFGDHLPRLRGMSPHTVQSYRDTFALFLRFLSSHQGREVAALDIGDSAVLELVGLGGAATAASPAVAAFAGRTMADAVATTETFDRICIGRSGRFRLSFLDFRGSPVGVDVRKVVETEITPAINTGILHAGEGLGQVGAGVARAPLACFQEALVALDATLR